MRKKILVIAALIITMLTAACGMSAEQIDSALTEVETSYQSGVYEQIPATLEKLDKAYNNMSDEQKSKFTELRPLMDNAVKNAPAIKEGLEKAQGNYDQKMYYEAQQELDKIKDYQMPPVEKTKYDDLQANVSSAIGAWKITEALQKIEALYNSGDYDLAATTITELDISAATEEQKKQYQSLQNKINNSKLLVQAESQYNSGSYTSASNTISQIDIAYLSTDQNQKYGSLKQKIATAKAEADKSINSTQKAIDIVKSRRKLDGNAEYDDYLGNVYSAEDKSSYYLVKVTTTRNANGQERYRVTKSNGYVEYLGSASDDANWEEMGSAGR